MQAPHERRHEFTGRDSQLRAQRGALVVRGRTIRSDIDAIRDDEDSLLPYTRLKELALDRVTERDEPDATGQHAKAPSPARFRNQSSKVTSASSAKNGYQGRQAERSRSQGDRRWG
jgi:hypothetical protein